MFKTKYRIKKTIKYHYTIYDAQYKVWYWPFWQDILYSISRKTKEDAKADIIKHQFKKEVEYFN